MKYNSNDRFCLDGQRLIVVSGDYGKNNAEYRTEIDTYAKVTSKGDYYGGPSHFEVKTKSGLTYIYGLAFDTYVHTQPGHALKAWKVDKIIDSYGNTIAFSYEADSTSGAHRLKEVNYTDNKISYEYENRDNIIVKYHQGYKVSITQRLKRVLVYTGNNEVRKYVLDYANESQGTKRSTLSSITESIKNEQGLSVDLKTLEFTYDSTTGGLTQSYKSPKTKTQDAHYVDFDSDGCMDVYDNDKIAYGDCVGNFSAWHDVPTDTSNKHVKFGDFNGDGLVDIFYGMGYQSPKIVYNNGYRSFAQPVTYTTWDHAHGGVSYYVADFNADGVSDVMIAEKVSYLDENSYEEVDIDHIIIQEGSHSKTFSSVSIMSNPPGSPDDIKIADFNADGLPDMYFVVSGADKIYLQKSTGHLFEAGATPNILSSKEDIFLVDLNGDGASDLYQVKSGNDAIWINNGLGVLSNNYASPAITGDAKTLRFIDVNADGALDLYQVKGSADDNIWLGNGNGYLQTPYALDIACGSNDLHFTDINGDGIVDMIEADSSNKIWLNNVRRPLLNNITNNTDQNINIYYSPMTDTNTYYNYSVNSERNVQAFNKISDGNIEITSAQSLVTSVDSNNGIGGQNTLNYKYYGYVINNTRGLQGFHRIDTCDEATGFCGISLLKQIGVQEYADAEGFQFTGMPYKVYAGVSDVLPLFQTSSPKNYEAV